MSTIRETHMYEFTLGDDVIIVDTDWCGYQYVTVNGHVVVDFVGNCAPKRDVIRFSLEHQAREIAEYCIAEHLEMCGTDEEDAA